MRKFLAGLFFLFIAHNSWGETYGNQWIKRDQKYFKIKIGRSGIHRIDYISIIPDDRDMMIVYLRPLNP